MPPSTSSCNLPARAILLVEDEDSVRQITRYVLESAGYLVLESSGPEPAISILSDYQGAINLLLTDVVMPTMSGAELAARLRLMRPGLTVMFMSGYARNAGLSQANFGSPDCYLQKPFSTRMLLTRVAEALSLPPNPREGSTEIRLPI
jgi:two-component system, cell cycle sensor histidine kinase and response regulator CckA